MLIMFVFPDRTPDPVASLASFVSMASQMPQATLVQHLAEKVFTCCKVARLARGFRHKTNLSSLFDQAMQFTSGMAKISEQQGKPETR